MQNKRLILMLTAFALTASIAAQAAEDKIYTITAKGGKYEPAQFDVPSGQKIHLVVKNADTAQIEFESYPLNQEQKIKPGDQIDAYVGPLEAGKTYEFFDDKNPDAKGVISAK